MEIEVETEKKVDSYYSSSTMDTAYTVCWGAGNIHFGFYPHLEDASSPILDFPEAAENLTKVMVTKGNITNASCVLDLGCGYGKPAIDLATLTGAEVWGVDLSQLHIDRARESLQAANAHRATQGLPTLRVQFVHGSFTELPREITHQTNNSDERRQFTHIWSQVAICHAHAVVETVFQQAWSCLAKGGKVVLCDFLGSDDEATEETKQHVWARLKFSTLHGHTAWRKLCTETGFEIDEYISLDKHMTLGYEQLSKRAYAYLENIASATQGEHSAAAGTTPTLAKDYAISAKASETGQIGMNLCVAHKP